MTFPPLPPVALPAGWTQPEMLIPFGGLLVTFGGLLLATCRFLKADPHPPAPAALPGRSLPVADL